MPPSFATQRRLGRRSVGPFGNTVFIHEVMVVAPAQIDVTLIMASFGNPSQDDGPCDVVGRAHGERNRDIGDDPADIALLFVGRDRCDIDAGGEELIQEGPGVGSRCSSQSQFTLSAIQRPLEEPRASAYRGITCPARSGDRGAVLSRTRTACRIASDNESPCASRCASGATKVAASTSATGCSGPSGTCSAVFTSRERPSRQRSPHPAR